MVLDGTKKLIKIIMQKVVKLMAGKNDNLIPMNERTKAEQTRIATMGGKASGIARNYKKEQIENLKMLLDTKTEDGTTYREKMNLGVLKGAIEGKSENYKVIMDFLDNVTSSNETPVVNINIVDNATLEKALYDEKD